MEQALASRVYGKHACAVLGRAGGKGPSHRYLTCCLSYYPLSNRDLEEMVIERGLHIDHTTIDRWVQHYERAGEMQSIPYESHG